MRLTTGLHADNTAEVGGYSVSRKQVGSDDRSFVVIPGTSLDPELEIDDGQTSQRGAAEHVTVNPGTVCSGPASC